jgi:hypothetical protein
LANIFDFIPPSVITGGGLGALALIAVWFVFTGRLVPGRIYAEMKADRDAWKNTAETQAARADVTARQMDRVLEQGQAIEKVLVPLQRILERALQEEGR